jgi:hypothetical protein
MQKSHEKRREDETDKLGMGENNVQLACTSANLNERTSGTEYTHTHAWVYKIRTP